MKTCAVCSSVYPEAIRFCPADGSMLGASADQSFPIGELVGGYRVVDRISQGGFGETFLVVHEALEKRSVMKVLYATDDNGFDRLRREFGFLSTLDDPAFARVYEFGMAWDQRPYLVMELVQGRPLQDVLQAHRRIGVAETLALGIRLARGLGRLHDAGFIHRDIKPANIMIPEAAGAPAFGKAKLLDFGVFGSLVESGSSRLTRTGMVAGTPRYMAPEQIQGLPQSPGTDVYGLALLLVEMLYGRLPFETEGSSAIALMARIVQTDLTIPEDPAIPEVLRALLSRSLSRDPTLRPADGAVFVEALEKVSNTDTVLLELLSSPDRASEVVVTYAQSAFGPEPRRSSGHVVYRPTPVAALAPQAGRRRTRRSRASGVKELASPHPLPRGTAWLLRALFAAALLVIVLLFELRGGSAGPVGGSPSTHAAIGWIAIGIALAVGGILLGNLVRRVARARLHDVEIDAERLLLGLNTKRTLSDTIQVEISQIITRCRALDERLLGVTILKMINEYDAAKESDERQAALMNVATLLEKLRGRLSPWYARFEKQLALATAMIGVASGLISVIAGVMKATSGTP